jgi:hypothetical protein
MKLKILLSLAPGLSGKLQNYMATNFEADCFMNMKTKINLWAVLVLSIALLGCRTPSTCHSPGSRQSGAVTDGLRMSLSVSRSGNPGNPAFEVAIQNAGEKDVCLNLGEMLANGKVMIPDKIGLNLTDSGGKLLELDFVDRRFPGVAGRRDDYMVPLRSGSTCTLELRLDQFVSPTTGDRMKLSPGRYEVSARFQGDGAETGNADMAGMKLMNFWKGKLQSNFVVIVE